MRGHAVTSGIGVGPLPCLIGDAEPGLVRLADAPREVWSRVWLLTHAEMVADLPRILSAESGRSNIANTRGSPGTDPPTIELHWPDHREDLVVDSTLAHLPAMDLDELVLDAIDRVIVDRRVAGTTG